jgi:hypothetical protein
VAAVLLVVHFDPFERYQSEYGDRVGFLPIAALIFKKPDKT